MPTPAAERREDDVVALVVASLRAFGLSIVVLDRPDRNKERADGLTVDAELAVGDGRWAMDVMTLRWRSQLEPQVKRLQTTLERIFGEDLRGRDAMLVVGGPVDSTTMSLNIFVELARQAIFTAEEQLNDGRMAQLRPRVDGVGTVEVWALSNTHADLAVELISSSGEPIAKKLRSQLSRAAELGHVTCLVLDQKGAGDLEFGANWLVRYPETVMGAVEAVEQEVQRRVDRVALVRPDDSLIWLRD